MVCTGTRNWHTLHRRLEYIHHIVLVQIAAALPNSRILRCRALSLASEQPRSWSWYEVGHRRLSEHWWRSIRGDYESSHSVQWMNERFEMIFLSASATLLTMSPPGDAILTCVQSMAPMHCGKSAMSANAIAFAKHSCGDRGIRTKVFICLRMASHTGDSTLHTVAWATPM